MLQRLLLLRREARAIPLSLPAARVLCHFASFFPEWCDRVKAVDGYGTIESMKVSARLLFAASLAVLVLTSAAWPEEVWFPLTVDYEVLRMAVRAHLLEGTGGGPKVWRTADGCGSFTLREFTINPVEGR